MFNKLFRNITLAALVILPVIASYSCNTASAQPIAAFESIGTPTALTLVGHVTASTVGTPNGTIVDSFVWNRGSTLVRTFVDGLTDTLVLNPRALIGKSDTVSLKTCAVYRANGNIVCSAVFTKIIPNADNQIPTIPVITSVDTL